MEISFELGANDIDLARRRDAAAGRPGRAAQALFLVLMLALGWAALRGGFLAIYALGVAAFLAMWLWRRARGGTARPSARGPGPRRLSLDDGGLRETAGSEQRYVSWRDVRRVDSAEGHTFVFLQGGKPPVIIPEGAVPEGAYEGFVRTLYESYVRYKSAGGR